MEGRGKGGKAVLSASKSAVGRAAERAVPTPHLDTHLPPRPRPVRSPPPCPCLPCSTIHYYNLKASLSAPQMMVVAEMDDPFVPLPDDLLVNLRDSRRLVDALLESLPQSYGRATQVESCMGPALQAAFLVMNHIGGKLLLFQVGAGCWVLGAGCWVLGAGCCRGCCWGG